MASKLPIQKLSYSLGLNSRDNPTRIPDSACRDLINLFPGPTPAPRAGVKRFLTAPAVSMPAHDAIPYEKDGNLYLFFLSSTGWQVGRENGSGVLPIPAAGGETLSFPSGEISWQRFQDALYVSFQDDAFPSCIIEPADNASGFMVRRGWLDRAISISYSGRANVDKYVSVAATMVRRTDAAAFDVDGNAKLMTPDSETDFLFNPGILESVDLLAERKVVPGIWSDVKAAAPFPVRSIHFPSDTVGYACGGSADDGSTPGVLKTSDGGATWATSPTPSHISDGDGGGPDITVLDLSTVFFITDSIGFIGGAAYNVGGDPVADRFAFVLKTSDGGATWTSDAVPFIYTSGFVDPAVTIKSVSAMHFASLDDGYVVFSPLGYNGIANNILKRDLLGNAFMGIGPYDTEANVSGITFLLNGVRGSPGLYVYGKTTSAIPKSFCIFQDDATSNWNFLEISQSAFFGFNAFILDRAASTAYLVGDAGTIARLYIDGNGAPLYFGSETATTSKNLYAVFSAGGAYIAYGDEGAGQRNDGTGWKAHASIVDGTGETVRCANNGFFGSSAAAGSGNVCKEADSWGINLSLAPTVPYSQLDPQATHIREYRTLEAESAAEASGLSHRWAADIPIRGPNSPWDGSSFPFSEDKANDTMNGVTDVCKVVGYNAKPPSGDMLAYALGHLWCGLRTPADPKRRGNWYYSETPQDVEFPQKWLSMFKTDTLYKSTDLGKETLQMAILVGGGDLLFFDTAGASYLRDADPSFEPVRVSAAPGTSFPYTVTPYLDGVFYLSNAGPCFLTQRRTTILNIFAAAEVWPRNYDSSAGILFAGGINTPRTDVIGFFHQNTWFLACRNRNLFLGCFMSVTWQGYGLPDPQSSGGQGVGAFRILPGKGGILPSRAFTTKGGQLCALIAFREADTLAWKFLDPTSSDDDGAPFTIGATSKSYYFGATPEMVAEMMDLVFYVYFLDSGALNLRARGDGFRFSKSIVYSGLSNASDQNVPEVLSSDYRRAVRFIMAEGAVGREFSISWSKPHKAPFLFRHDGFQFNLRPIQSWDHEYVAPNPNTPVPVIDAGVVDDDRSEFSVIDAGNTDRDPGDYTTFIDAQARN